MPVAILSYGSLFFSTYRIRMSFCRSPLNHTSLIRGLAADEATKGKQQVQEYIFSLYVHS